MSISLSEEVSNALADIREGLLLDGYELTSDVSDERVVSVSVVATEAACEDCLVPKQIMETIVRSSLPAAIADSTIHLTYPNE